MLPTTIDAVKSILRADPTVSPSDRARILNSVRTGGDGAAQPAPPQESGPRILRRVEVARLLGRSVRSVDHLSAQGILLRVTLPGRRRAAGFRLSDVQRLVGGAE